MWGRLGFEEGLNKRERRKSEREKWSVETERKEQIPFNEKIGALERQRRRDKCKACDKKSSENTGKLCRNLGNYKMYNRAKKRITSLKRLHKTIKT